MLQIIVLFHWYVLERESGVEMSDLQADKPAFCMYDP